MASADGSILIRTKVDTSGVKNGVNSIQSGVSKINGSLAKLGGVIAAVFSVYKLIEFGKEAINLASDLTEVQNVVDVAFGEMSYKIEEFSKTSIQNFGISELSAKTMASTFMAISNGMKQGLDVASDMAVEMTGRLADIMSFYNKSLDEVNTIGRAVYSGETEPLKQIGVIMTQAQLKTFALSKGYKTLYTDMDAANQLLVRQQYFLDVTNQAAGDFVRTQSSWANQTRILSELWKQFLTLVGSRLIQALSPVISVINSVLTALINLGTAMANVFGWQVKQSSVAASTAGSVADTADSESDIENAAKGTNNALKKQLAYFDDINTLSSDTASGSGTAGGTAGGGTISAPTVDTSAADKKLTDFEKKIKNFFDELRKALEPTIEAFNRLWNEGLKLLGDFAFGTLMDFLNDFLIPLGKWTLGTGLPRFLDITNEMLKSIDWEKLRESLDGMYIALEKLAEITFDAILDFYESFIAPLAVWTMSYAIPELVDLITAFAEDVDWQQLNNSLEKFWKVLEPFVEGFAKGFLDFFVELCENIGIPTLNALVDIFDGLSTAIGGFDSKKIKTLGEVFGGLTAALVSFKFAVKIVSDIVTMFSKLSAIATTVLSFAESITALGKAFAGLATANPELLTQAIAYFEQTFPSLTSAIETTIDNFVGGIFDGVMYILKSTFNWSDMISYFNAALENFENAINGEEIGKNILLGIINGFGAALAFIYEPINNFFMTFFNAVKDAFGIASPAKTMFPLGQYIFLGIIEGFTSLFSTFSVYMQEFWATYVLPWFSLVTWTALAQGIYDGISAKWEELVAWWGTAIVDFWNTNILPWFSLEKWTEIGTNMKNGLYIGFKTILVQIANVANGIISTIESTVNKVIESINKFISNAIKSMNKLPGVKLSIPSISPVQFGRVPIPALAQGAVIPANKEFMAILGDQKHGTNIEAPLDTIKQAVSEVLASNIGASSAQYSGNLIVKLGESEVARTLLQPLLNELSRQGYDTSVLGVV